MKILVVAATESEVAFLKNSQSPVHIVNTLVTGAGMIATTYELTKHLLSQKYDLAINCGVAGSFSRSLKIGEVVCIENDTFSELGAEDDTHFLRLQDMGLSGKDSFRRTASLETNLKKVNSITVNTVHGNESSIEKTLSRQKADIESMEGAAFFFVCEKEGIPALQIRAISNYIEKRNRAAWDIELAISNLQTAISNIINQISD